ncbi:MAG TPA: type III pantothenate kinase, partial [Acidimicrobiales bacterium]|nr:type III pantothenate kinase [Acidimicrobiales bacterium]
LTIDVGNTQTVLGLFDDQALTHHWRISTNDERTSDELALLVADLLRLRGIEFHPEQLGIAVSSVVPRITASLRQMADEWFGVKAVVLEPGTRMGMPILYDNPKEVGADRIANAVGAYDLYGGPAIVVDFGTATTLDAISAKGEYLGGAIIPGIEISLDALFARAAALRRFELVEPRNVIGKNTVESMQSGAIYGFTAQVDGLATRMKKELGGTPAVIATGGLAGLIAPLSLTIQYHEPWLTLVGLRIVWERNQ